MMRAVVLALPLLVLGPSVTAEPPPDFKLTDEWARVFQRIGICGWWDSYERTNQYNPMSYQWRNRLAAICFAGNGMMDMVQWGHDVDRERPPNRIKQPKLRTILEKGPGCDDNYDDGDRCG